MPLRGQALGLPLNAESSQVSVCSTFALNIALMEALSARTQSYSENMFTYPLPPTPLKKVKEVMLQVIDGVEQLVEIEVQVQEPLKRLFMFPSARRR